MVTNYDFYDLILKGDTSKDIRLQEGDSVFYPLISSTIRIDGAVQRPGKFELLEGENLSDALEFSGLKNTLDQKIEFSRFNDSTKLREVSILDDNQVTRDRMLQSGDSINVLSNSNQIVSNVLLSGEFTYPVITTLAQERQFLSYK